MGKIKLKMFERAEADVQYADGKFTAKGLASLTFKGFEQVEVFLEIEEGRYAFGARIDLSHLDSVKEGAVELNVENKGGEYSISGGGTVVPDILVRKKTLVLLFFSIMGRS